MTRVIPLLFVLAFTLFTHLAYDDWKELGVWDWEVLAFFVSAWLYSALGGYNTVALAALITVIVLYAGAHKLLPIADGVALVSVVLLADTPLIAGLILLTLTLVDTLYRLKKCGLAEMCPTPLITELFVSFVIAKLGVVLV